ncbi:hypothetical protein BSLG_000134 [Batrachochytrium salamandrivorans]|nr:hypothetical protein BSLG_000134 [Batrachochytrium salamandrivorans]
MVSDDVRRSTLISAFFMHIWPEFPLFNQEQFLASDMAKSEILILAMLCNAAKFIDPPNEDPNSDPKLLVSRCNAGDRYFNKAVSQFGGAIMVTPSYENILAFYYLACYAAASGKFGGGCVLFSIAVRFAQLIGLDNERQNPESYKWSQEERELRRRIWWTLYEVDRYSSTSGRMSMLIVNSSPLNTPFPCPDKLLHTVAPMSSFSADTPLKGMTRKMGEIPDLATQLLVQHSSSTVFPSIASYRITILMIATKTYNLVLDEHDVNTNSQLLHDVESFSRRRQDISKDLVLFYQSLPDWISSVSHYTTYTNESANFKPTGVRLSSVIPMDPHTAVQLCGATVLVFYHHTRICLFISHFYRLFEFGLFNAIQTDATFSACLESALEIYEVLRWLMRSPMHCSAPPPSLCKTIESAACIIHIAHSVGFMGVTSDMRNEILDVFEARVRTMMRFWVWPGKALQTIMSIRSQTFVMNSQTPIWI